MAVVQMVRMAAVMLVVLVLLGWLPWAAIGPVRRRVNGWVAAPFFGLAIVCVGGWYWLEWGTGGMRVGIAIIGLLWVLGTALLSALSTRPMRDLLPRCTRRSAVASLVVVLVALALSGFMMRNGLRGSDPVPTYMASVDMASYAVYSQHFVEHGHGDPGPVVANDLGNVGRVDAAGVRPYLSTVAVVNGTDVATALVPAMAVAIVLLALAAVVLVVVVTGASPLLAAVLGLVVLLPFSFTYVVGSYYLSQVLSMAGVVAFVAVVLAIETETWTDALWAAVPASFLFAPVLLTYPQMAVASVVVVGPLVVFVRFTRFDWVGLRAAVGPASRTAVSVIVSAAASAVLLAPVLGDLLDRASQLQSTTAGLRLAEQTPLQIMGLESFRGMSNIRPFVPDTFYKSESLGAARWWFEVVLVMALVIGAGVVAVRTRRSFPLFTALAAGLVLASYRLMFMHYGVSYQQWKWITFYSPFLVLAVVVAGFVLVDALRVLDPRWLFPTVVGSTVGMVVALVMVASSYGVWSKDWYTVATDVVDLRRVAETDLAGVNLDVDGWYETMWAAYYLMPTDMNLVSGSLFSASSGRSGWTVTKPKSIKGSPAKIIPINGSFALVCAKEPCGTSPVLPTR